MRATIVIDAGHRLHAKKVAKIATFADGGFAIFAPYHSARVGRLAMFDMNYADRQFHVPLSEMHAQYSAEDQVKLSYHSDGFVQFSSVNTAITSGRDPVTGEPRGLGLLSQPLSRPITSGPSAGILLWGLEDFQSYTRAKRGELTVSFGDEDFREPQYSPPGWNAYHIEFFVLQNVPSDAVHEYQDRHIAALAFYNFEVPATIFRLRLIPLEANNNVLGILARRQIASFPSPSGFMLNSPSQTLRRADSETIGRVMHATYPNI